MIPQPNWGDYTSIHNWYFQSCGEYSDKHGSWPTTAHIPKKYWEKIRQNHFISVGGHLFFGLSVKVHENNDNAWVTNPLHEQTSEPT